MPRVEWSFFLPAEDHRQLKWLNTRVRGRYTRWGRMILPMLIIGSAVSSVGTQISGFLVLSFLLSLLFAAFLLSLFIRPRLKVERRLPPSPTAGGICAYHVLVTNIGRAPARSISVFEQTLPYGLYTDWKHPDLRNTVDWLDPGETARLTLVFRTPRRGTFELAPLETGSSFPSGIVRRLRRTGRRDTFTVIPRIIPPPRRLPRRRQTFQPGGIAHSSRTGDSYEFASTRDYRPGDRMKNVHWASSARAGKIIVKEYVEEYLIRVGIFLDTELRRFEKHASFESRISLCAGFAEEILDDNDVVDFFSSDPRHPHVQLGRRVDRMEHLLEVLAMLEGDRRVELAESAGFIREHAPRLSELIVLLKDWDEPRRAFIRGLHDLDVPLRVIVVRDRPPTLPVADEEITVHTPAQLQGAAP